MVLPRRCAAYVVACIALVPSVGFGQGAQPPSDPKADKPSTPDTDPKNPGLWNTDVMMETAVQQLVRRYELTKDQEAYTRSLLNQRVRKFLKVHEHDLRSLLTEMIDMQFNPAKVDAGRMEEWSHRALPVFAAAREAILVGNKEWGDILNDEQKKTHKFDLDQMDTNFKDMDEKFTRWSKGGWTPDDNKPRRAPAVARPQQPIKNDTSSVFRTGFNEDTWEAYVTNFCRQYNLTKDQETAARGVLQEMVAKAKNYRSVNKEKIATAEARIISARQRQYEKDGPAEFQKANRENQELLRPITETMFNDLKKRLEALPTVEQRAAYDANQAVMRERDEKARKAWQEKLMGNKPGTQPAKAGAGATQPADSAPAKPPATPAKTPAKTASTQP